MVGNDVLDRRRAAGRRYRGTPLLRPLFGGNDPTFVVSNVAVLEHLCARGLRCVVMDRALADPPEDVVLVLDQVDVRSLPLRELRRGFSRSRVLAVPCAAFDARPHAVTYTLDRLLESDFTRSLERGHELKRQLEASSSPLVFCNAAFPDERLTCELPDGIRADLLAEPGIDAGMWRETPQYFEVSLRLPVVVTGDLRVTGMLAARGPHLPAELAQRHDEAIRLVRDFALGHSGGVLQSGGGRPVGFLPPAGASADSGFIHTVRRLSTVERRPTYVEVSLGTNALDGPVRWDINSCMNEGVVGLHVAVGDAVTGVHLDFVSAGTELAC